MAVHPEVKHGDRHVTCGGSTAAEVEIIRMDMPECGTKHPYPKCTNVNDGKCTRRENHDNGHRCGYCGEWF